VDLSHFHRADSDERLIARERLNLPLDVPHVVCVGRVTRQKGQDVLVAAWSAVRAQCPDAMLVIVGSGDLLEPLRATAPPGVIFTGHVDDPRPWYAAADLVVLPSRWEGLPLTLLEALAVGRSVVGSDIPGISEALPEEAGTLVRADDAGALAEAITYRITSREVITAEETAAARYAADHADARRTRDTLATVTAGLAGSHR
jgi:glycosyltransferase involved in cell wall biosynthesis